MKHLIQQTRLDNVEAYATCMCATAMCSCECICNCSCNTFWDNAGLYYDTTDNVALNNQGLIGVRYDQNRRIYL